MTIRQSPETTGRIGRIFIHPVETFEKNYLTFLSLLIGLAASKIFLLMEYNSLAISTCAIADFISLANIGYVFKKEYFDGLKLFNVFSKIYVDGNYQKKRIGQYFLNPKFHYLPAIENNRLVFKSVS